MAENDVDLTPEQQRIIEAARRMIARGLPRQQVDAFVARAESRLQRNAKDQTEARAPEKMGAGMYSAALLDRVASGGTLGVAPLLVDAGYAAFGDRSFKELRDERKERNKQLGLAGTAADLVGGLATGGTILKTLSAIPKVARMGKATVAAAEGFGQGGITGAAEGLDDLSTEGAKKAAVGGAIGAGLGATIAPLAGWAVGGVAGWREGRKLTKELVARGVDPTEAQAIAKQLPDLGESGVKDALSRIDEYVAMGKGGDVMAADVIPQARRTLRAATNLSKEGDELASTRLRERDANVGVRARNDLMDVSKFTPQEAAMGVKDMAKAREEAASPLYEMFRGLGPLPETPALKKLSTLGAFQEALATVQKESPTLQDLPWNDARVLDAIYKRIGNKAFKSQHGFETGEARTALLSAMDEASDGLYSPAVKEFSDHSAAMEAYEAGQDALGKSGGDYRATLRDTDAANKDFVDRGVLDAAHARVSRKAPNPDLGAAGKAASGVGQESVGTMDAREVMREVLGEKGYQRLVDRARAEAEMSATSRAAQSNSSTAKQGQDIGSVLNLITTLGESLSVNPAWMLTMFGRREMGKGFGKMMQRLASKDARAVADALTRGGDAEARGVLEMLLEELKRQGKAQAFGQAVGARTRNAVARAAAPNQ